MDLQMGKVVPISDTEEECDWEMTKDIDNSPLLPSVEFMEVEENKQSDAGMEQRPGGIDENILTNESASNVTVNEVKESKQADDRTEQWPGGIDEKVLANESASNVTINKVEESKQGDDRTKEWPGGIDENILTNESASNVTVIEVKDGKEAYSELKKEFEMQGDIGSKAESNANKLDSSNDVQRIETLHDSITFFKLKPVLRNLEKSLGDFRKCKRTVKEHEDCVKLADKEMQKKCLSFHPDRYSNRGSSEEELAVAQGLQIALNTTRTALSMISREFLEEPHVCYKYEFFMDARLDSLGNEDQIQKRLTDVLGKVRILSEIKREIIVAQTQKFLKASHSCVSNYEDLNAEEFMRNHNLALFHLEKCCGAYGTLRLEFAKVERNCEDEGLVKMSASIRRMSESSSTEERFLMELLQESGKRSLDGTIQVFLNLNLLDEYFVLPFAYYVNVLLMCSIVLKITLKPVNTVMKARKALKKLLTNNSPKFLTHGQNLEELQSLSEAYYLVSFMKDKTRYINEVRHLMDGSKPDQKALKRRFDQILKSLEASLEAKFAIDSFKVCSARANLIKKLKQLNEGATSEILEEDEKFQSHMESFREMSERRKEEFLEIVRKNEELKQRLVQKASGLIKIPME